MATATTIPLPPSSPTSRITGTAGQSPCYHQGLGPNASAWPASPPPPRALDPEPLQFLPRAVLLDGESVTRLFIPLSVLLLAIRG